MPLFPIWGDDDRPHLTGIWQRAYLLRRLAEDDVAEMDRFVNLFVNGYKRVVHNETARWEPTWAHYVIEGKAVEIVIQGTENIRQVMLHLAGVVDLEKHGEQYVNRQWYLVTRSIFDDLRDVVTAEGIERVTVSGHSYGGGVAELLADELADLLPDAVSVEVCTFGGPRARTGRWLERGTSRSVRVVNRGDVVPLLPQQNATITGAGVGSLVTLRSGVKTPWTHTGTRVELIGGGNALLGTEDQEETLGAWGGTARDWTTAHPIYQYERRLYAIPGVETQGSAAAATPAEQSKIDAAPMASQLIQNVSDDLAAALNAAYYGVSSGPISASVVDAFGSVASVVTGADLLPPVNIGFFPGGSVAVVSGFTKVTMCINNGVYGHQESHVVQIGVNNRTGLKDAVTQLCAKRAHMLGCSEAGGTNAVKSRGSPIIEFVKLTDAFLPKQGFLEPVDEDGYHGLQGVDPLPADALFLGLAMNLRGTLAFQESPGEGATQPAQRSTFTVVGQPDDMVKQGQFTNGLMVTGVRFRNYLANYLSFLGALNPAASTANAIKWGFLGLRSDQGKKAVSKVEAVAGEWVLTITGHGFTTRDRVRVTGMGKVWNGQYSIAAVTANTVTLNKAPVQGHAIPKLGSLQRVGLAIGRRNLAFYQYDNVDRDLDENIIVNVRKRNPGREFLGVSFQSRTRRER